MSTDFSVKVVSKHLSFPEMETHSVDSTEFDRSLKYELGSV